MLLNRRILASLVVILAAPLLAGCAVNREYSPLLRSEPAADSVLTRSPRTLRLLYDALPDVSRSRVALTGPAGEYRMRGMHTMGADDLMMEIFEPAVTDGDYTVSWSTVVGDDPSPYQGSFNFSVRTGR
jgi:methionine-rich copper-binding protein CopC